MEINLISIRNHSQKHLKKKPNAFYLENNTFKHTNTFIDSSSLIFKRNGF